MSATSQAYTITEALLGLREADVRRKGNQRGSVRRRGPSWTVIYSSYTQDASGNLVWKQQERVVGPAIGPKRLSLREARNKAYDEFVSKANGETSMPQGRATLEQFYDVRFTADHVIHLKKSGRIHYKTMWSNHVKPTLGNIQLGDVRPGMVQQLINAKIEAGLSIQTIVHIRNVISAIFRHARALEFFEGALPTEAVRIPEMRRQERRAITWQQVLSLAELVPVRHRALILLMGQLGLRIGEAAGLRWRDVNLGEDEIVSAGDVIKGNSIYIRTNWTKGERTSLKTATSRRAAPLTAETWVALTLHRELSKWTAPDDPVFAGNTGQPLDAHNVGQRSLKTAGAKIGCPWISWHVLRHTAATLSDKAGLTASEKQKILGHATAAMSRLYTHPEMDDVRTKLETIQ